MTIIYNTNYDIKLWQNCNLSKNVKNYKKQILTKIVGPYSRNERREIIVLKISVLTVKEIFKA